jgi:hypothetical protein
VSQLLARNSNINSNQNNNNDHGLIIGDEFWRNNGLWRLETLEVGPLCLITNGAQHIRIEKARASTLVADYLQEE